MKFTKIVKADFEDNWFDAEYYKNKLEKMFMGHHLPFNIYTEGPDTIIIKIRKQK